MIRLGGVQGQEEVADCGVCRSLLVNDMCEVPNRLICFD